MFTLLVDYNVGYFRITFRPIEERYFVYTIEFVITLFTTISRVQYA